LNNTVFTQHTLYRKNQIPVTVQHETIGSYRSPYSYMQRVPTHSSLLTLVAQNISQSGYLSDLMY